MALELVVEAATRPLLLVCGFELSELVVIRMEMFETLGPHLIALTMTGGSPTRVEGRATWGSHSSLSNGSPTFRLVSLLQTR